MKNTTEKLRAMAFVGEVSSDLIRDASYAAYNRPSCPGFAEKHLKKTRKILPPENFDSESQKGTYHASK